VIGWLPFWFRFGQCLYKYNETNLWHPNLVNAGKYFAGMLLLYFTKLYVEKKISAQFFFLYGVFATIYSYSWDIVMDWGLLRDGEILRKKLFYPKWFYYFVAVTNLILRFAWAITLFDV
jgi:hypothetical protein